MTILNGVIRSKRLWLTYDLQSPWIKITRLNM